MDAGLVIHVSEHPAKPHREADEQRDHCKRREPAHGAGTRNEQRDQAENETAME